MASGLEGPAAILMFAEVPPAAEQDFGEWYNREHLDERVNMEGFRRARRYVAVSGRPKFMAFYEARSLDDLQAPAYLAWLADQTAWSKRVVAQFTVFERMTCAVTVDHAHGIGGSLSVLRAGPA